MFLFFTAIVLCQVATFLYSSAKFLRYLANFLFCIGTFLPEPPAPRLKVGISINILNALNQHKKNSEPSAKRYSPFYALLFRQLPTLPGALSATDSHRWQQIETAQ